MMAQEALRDWAAQINGSVENSDTFGHYCRRWLHDRKRSGLYASNTLATDERHVNALALSPLSPLRMDAITPSDCREALLWIKEHPQKPNLAADGILSGTTMVKVHRMAKQIFQQAVDDERLSRNPMAKIKPPKKDTEEVEALSWERMMELLDKLDKLPLSGYVMCMYLIVCLALRRAEAVAVLDCEFSSTTMRVSQACKETDGTVGPPKSEAGNRMLPVMPRLSAKAAAWRQHRCERGVGDSPFFACNI